MGAAEPSAWGGSWEYQQGQTDPNWSWFWKDLAFAAPFGTGINTDVSPGHNRRLPLQTTSLELLANPALRQVPQVRDSTTRWAQTRLGKAMELSGAGSQVRLAYPTKEKLFFPRSTPGGWPGMTIFIHGEGFAATGAQPGYASTQEGLATGDMLAGAWSLYTVFGIPAFSWYGVSAAGTVSFGISTLAGNGSMALRWQPKPSVAPPFRFFLTVDDDFAGFRTAASTVATGPSVTPPVLGAKPRMAVGRRASRTTVGAAGSSILGRYTAVYVWWRMLSDKALRALHANPLGPFVPERHRIHGIPLPAAPEDPCNWFDGPAAPDWYDAQGAPGWFGPQAVPDWATMGPGTVWSAPASGDWFEEREC